jgi:hypothetical protein
VIALDASDTNTSASAGPFALALPVKMPSSSACGRPLL